MEGQITSPLDAGREKLSAGLPQVMKNFSQFRDSVIGDAALTAKQKELIAVGISVAIRCSPCISNHVARAWQLGAGKSEIMEAISVAILMGGGPALAYGAEAALVLDSLRESNVG
jgi:AhpD family alkylhydroperoxidase